MYPTKKNCFFENWDNFVLKIIPLMINGIKDGNSKVILNNLLEVDNTDIGKYRLYMSCHKNISLNNLMIMLNYLFQKLETS